MRRNNWSPTAAKRVRSAAGSDYRYEPVWSFPIVSRRDPSFVVKEKAIQPALVRSLLANAKWSEQPQDVPRCKQYCYVMPDESPLLYESLTKTFLESNVWRMGLQAMLRPATMLRYPRGHQILQHNDYLADDPTHGKLTCIIMLSRRVDYIGGKLVLGGENQPLETINLTPGDAIVFPAGITHRVSPVESGERIVLVAWACGSPLS